MSSSSWQEKEKEVEKEIGDKEVEKEIGDKEKEKEAEKEIGDKDEEKKEEEEEDTPEEKEEKAKIKGMPPQERTKYILASGALRLLSLIWLLAQGDGFIIKRMQDLPDEAFIPPDKAAKLFDSFFGIIVISYGWMSKKHPDPKGLHIRAVQKYLRKHKSMCDGDNFRRQTDYGIFWDFASLPQDQPDGTKKSAKEKRVFDKGLGAINLLYGDSKTLVIQLTNMPKELTLPAEYETNLTPYNTRGWCYFEATVSGILKDSDQLLDLGVGQDALEREDADWNAVMKASSSARQPPLTPDDMTAELQKRKFTNGSDTALVIKKYREFFEEVTPTATALDFENRSTGPGWNNAELMLFAKALPAFTACQRLFLHGHTALTGDSLKHLQEKIPALPALNYLRLPEHLEDTTQGKAFKEAWAAAGKTAWKLGWW